MGLFEGAILWGFALTIAIYVTASISTAHLNPAVTCAMAVMRSKEFSQQYAGAYILSQLTGSFCAALVNFWIFLPHLRKYEGTSILRWLVGLGRWLWGCMHRLMGRSMATQLSSDLLIHHSPFPHTPRPTNTTQHQQPTAASCGAPWRP